MANEAIATLGIDSEPSKTIDLAVLSPGLVTDGMNLFEISEIIN